MLDAKDNTVVSSSRIGAIIACNKTASIMVIATSTTGIIIALSLIDAVVVSS